MKQDIDPKKLVKLLEDVGISAKFIGEQLEINQVESYLKSQYNALAKIFHPDNSYTKSADQFKKAAESWDILDKIRPIEIYFTCCDLAKKKKTKTEIPIPDIVNPEVSEEVKSIAEKLEKFFLGQYFRELQNNLRGAYFIINSPNKLYENTFMLTPSELVKDKWFKKKINTYNSILTQKKKQNLEEKLVGIDNQKDRLNNRRDKIEEHTAWIKSLAEKISEDNGSISEFLKYISQLRNEQLEDMLNSGGEVAKRTAYLKVLEQRFGKLYSMKIQKSDREKALKRLDILKNIRIQMTRNYDILYGMLPEEDRLKLKDLKSLSDRLSAGYVNKILEPDEDRIRVFIAAKIHEKDPEIKKYLSDAMRSDYEKIISEKKIKYTPKDIRRMINTKEIDETSRSAIQIYMQRDYLKAKVDDVVRKRLKTTHIIGRRSESFDENKERLDNSTKVYIAEKKIQLDAAMSAKDLLDTYKKICTPVMNKYLNAMPPGETHVFKPITILNIQNDLTISYANFNPSSDTPPSPSDFIRTNRKLVLFTSEDLFDYRKVASNTIAPSNQLVATNDYVSEKTVSPERLIELKVYNTLASKPYKNTYIISSERVGNEDVYRVEGKIASRSFKELTNPDIFQKITFQ